MFKWIFKSYKNIFIDKISILQLILVSFSFLETFRYTFYILIGTFFYHLYKIFKKDITVTKLINWYFLLLVYSIIFFRSIHTLIVAFNIIINIYYLFTNKKTKRKINIRLEIFIVIFFILILLNQLLIPPRLKTIDAYFYMLFYPILFYLLKKNNIQIAVEKTKKVFITSVIVATFILLFINLALGSLKLSTNTFFAESLDLSHVYFGLFLGTAICFVLMLKATTLNFYVYRYVFISFLLGILYYVGARMSLIATILVFLLFLITKTKLKFSTKIIIIPLVIIIFSISSYKLIPRVKDDVSFTLKVYNSVKNNNKEDLVLNSWRNMYQRFLVTKYTINEIKKNFVVGVGLQNVTNILTVKIHKDGYKYYQPLNPHNQYLHFLLGMGFFGFMYFLFLLIFLLKTANKNFYFYLFFIIVMFTESLLVRVKGISLFFLFSLIFSYKLSKLNA